MSKILNAICDEVWAIQESKLEAIAEFLEKWASNTNTPLQPLARERDVTSPNKRVGVVNVFGTISRRGNMLTQASGGTSVSMLSNAIDSLVADNSVDSILLNIDSPGGGVGGIPELAEKIYKSRSKKPIYALADTLAASAAYWLGSAATKFIATPSAEVGSIGVYMIHYDESKYLENKGLKATIIKAGKYKAEGSGLEPLSDESLGYYQSRVDEYYSMFTDSVAKYRGVSQKKVIDSYGQGRTVSASSAKSAGMVDRVATFETLIKELSFRGKL